MDENQSLQVAPQMTQLSVADAKSQAGFIHQILMEVMVKGEHYGVIPGCGDKPALLKAGAEKLNLVFRMAPKYDVKSTDLGSGHREYSVRCDLYHITTGNFLGSGLGSCSTMESKYRYRGNEVIPTGVKVPKEYWDLKRAGKFDEMKEKIGKGYVPQKIDGEWIICEKGEKKENPDIADTYNTCLKMAKKRAHVDAVLTATAASDIFTQDVEEILPENPADKVPPPPPPPTAKAPPSPVHDAEIVNDAIEPSDPQNEAKEAAERVFGKEAPAEPAHFPPARGYQKKDGCISEKQSKRFYAISKGAGRSDAEIKAFLKTKIGSEHSSDIPWRQYESICTEIASVPIHD